MKCVGKQYTIRCCEQHLVGILVLYRVEDDELRTQGEASVCPGEFWHVVN